MQKKQEEEKRFKGCFHLHPHPFDQEVRSCLYFLTSGDEDATWIDASRVPLSTWKKLSRSSPSRNTRGKAKYSGSQTLPGD